MIWHEIKGAFFFNAIPNHTKDIRDDSTKEGGISMKGDKTKVVASGVSGLELLTIVFVVLKLLKKIEWSWWWVLAPAWIPIAIVAVIIVVNIVIIARK